MKKRDVRQIFDQSDDYDEQFKGQLGRAVDKAERHSVFEYIYNDKPQGIVLDLGCGTGRYTIDLLNQSTRVIGLDLSPKMVKIAKKKLGKNSPLNHVDFLLGDAEKLPFKRYSFDTIICVRVIQHVPDLQKFVNELARILKQDGKVIILTYNLLNPLHFLKSRIEGFLATHPRLANNELLKKIGAEFFVKDNDYSLWRIKFTLEKVGLAVKEWNTVLLIPHNFFTVANTPLLPKTTIPTLSKLLHLMDGLLKLPIVKYFGSRLVIKCGRNRLLNFKE